MAHISAALRKEVTARAKGLCEYCQAAQITIIDMEIDHIVPESLGGQATEDNLCLTCMGCNRNKGAFHTAYDPETGQEVPLFNPRTQNWHEHFRWDDSDTKLLGLTPTGRATVERLKINREKAVAARALWVKAGWHPPR